MIAHEGKDVWVFAYGSLIWRPDFDFEERLPAAMAHCARRFSMWSWRYRGTQAAPGLVLALEEEPGALCRGVAYRIAAAKAEREMARLRAREMMTGAYIEALRPASLPGRAEGAVNAICYMIRPDHPQHAAGLSLEAQARIIARARGEMGPNTEYLFNTLEALRAEGAPDAELERLGELTRAVMERRE